MTLVFAIPNAQVRTNVERSMSLLDWEGGYPRIFSPSDYSVLDSVTDTDMIAKALTTEDGGAHYTAMDMSGYSRYWHGYQVILRPVLRFFHYHEMRMIMGTALLLLLTGLTVQLSRGADGKAALALMLSLCATNFFIVPMSMQLANMHFLMVLACFAVLRAVERGWSAHRLNMLAFGIGACAAFFDLLTTPLITLGMPLLLLLWQRAHKQGTTLCGELTFVAAQSVAWGCGYGCTFSFKWVLGTLVTGKDIVADALNQLGFRMNGSGDSVFATQDVFRSNLRGILSPRLESFLPLICGCIALTLVVAILLDRTVPSRIPKVLPMLLVGTFPYVWYLTLRSHSGSHAWFTFRVQMITVMALTLALLYVVDGRACTKRIKGFIAKRSR